MNNLVCPCCHNVDNKPGAQYCWVCGFGFPGSDVDDEAHVLRKAIETYGPEHQQLIAIEEMSELQKELCKRYRGFENLGHIIEEIADVEIMLDQLVMMFHCRFEVNEVRFKKIDRLRQRIAETLREREEGKEE